MSLLPVLSLGFVLGMTHATDADHIAAMSTVVAERKRLRSAAWAGALWGLGHTAMVVLVGGAIVLFRLVVPEKLALSLELGVAGMLIVLGARALLQLRVPSPKHAHAPRDGLRSVAIGLVHGLAGSAAVALAVLSQVESPGLGIAYLCLFGVGTMVGMALVTSALSLPFLFANDRLSGLAGRLGPVTGLASITLGALLAYRICVTEGLLL